jgi:hypothetical protein
MSYERQTEPNLLEAYEQNHGQLLQLMGELQAAIAAHYRNDIPREPEHIGKQEELKVMVFAALEFARKTSA